MGPVHPHRTISKPRATVAASAGSVCRGAGRGFGVFRRLGEVAEHIRKGDVRAVFVVLPVAQHLAAARELIGPMSVAGSYTNAVNFTVFAGQCPSSGKGVAAVMFWMTHCGLIQRR